MLGSLIAYLVLVGWAMLPAIADAYSKAKYK